MIQDIVYKVNMPDLRLVMIMTLVQHMSLVLGL